MNPTKISMLGALLLLGVALAVMPTTGATSAVLTSSLTLVSPPSQVTLQGSPTILANYTNSPSVPPQAIAVLVVHNSVGQTVGIFYGTASVSSGQSYVPFYIVMYGLSSGHYTGTVFVTTSDWVPITTESSVAIVL